MVSPRLVIYPNRVGLEPYLPLGRITYLYYNSQTVCTLFSALYATSLILSRYTARSYNSFIEFPIELLVYYTYSSVTRPI
jgi:hypothetical protein